MSQVSLGSFPVLNCHLVVPLQGAPTAWVDIDSATAPTGAMVLSFANESGPPVTFAMTVVTSTEWQGRSKVFLVGGAGGLAKPVVARSYVETPARIPLADLIRDAGEVLDPSVNVDPAEFSSWTRASAPAERALSTLARELGLTWRVLPMGKIWIGTDTWAPFTTDLTEFDDDGGKDIAIFAPSAPTLLPGVTIGGRKVTGCVYQLDSKLRLEVMFDRQERSEFETAIRGVLTELVYLGDFDATVGNQNSDGSLDVTCDDARIGAVGSVPIRGLLSAKYVVASGTRCRVSFANGGDPQKPFAHSFDAAQDGKAVVRVGDSLHAGVLIATAGPYPVSFTYLPAAPFVAGAPLPPLAVALDSGQTTSGSDVVFLDG